MTGLAGGPGCFEKGQYTLEEASLPLVALSTVYWSKLHLRIYQPLLVLFSAVEFFETAFKLFVFFAVAVNLNRMLGAISGYIVRL
jgi:hypothetical protein